MKRWIISITQQSKPRHAVLFWILRVGYYYLILIGLFVLYVVLKERTAAPYIYSNF